MKSKLSATPALAIMSLLCVATAAQAQVRDYDTVYPMGAPFTIKERNGVVPGEQAKMLNGRVLYDQNGEYYEAPRKQKFHRSDDTVYGHTMELNIGLGGAHLD
jgi:hypothetical protein